MGLVLGYIDHDASDSQTMFCLRHHPVKKRFLTTTGPCSASLLFSKPGGKDRENYTHTHTRKRHRVEGKQRQQSKRGGGKGPKKNIIPFAAPNTQACPCWWPHSPVRISRSTVVFALRNPCITVGRLLSVWHYVMRLVTGRKQNKLTQLV